MERTGHTPAVRRLGPADGQDILSLYAHCGRDGAWCGADMLSAVFSAGAWWGGFSETGLCLCAPSAPADAALPQAAMLRAALPDISANTLLLPPAVSEQGTALAETLLPLLTAALAGETDTAQQAMAKGDMPQAASIQQTEKTAGGVQQTAAEKTEGMQQTPAKPLPVNRIPGLVAAVPMKYPPELLRGYFAAGLAAFRVRPLLSLRPNYLLAFCTPAKPVPGTVQSFCMPLDGTLAISRLLEQGHCLTALRYLPPDARLMGELRRAAPV